MSALSVQASVSDPDNDNKEKPVRKEEPKYTLTSAVPKTNLSLDAGFRTSGILKTQFKLSSDNTVNVKSIMTYKKGNVTYIVPYSVQVQEAPVNMRFQQLQMKFKLPFRKD